MIKKVIFLFGFAPFCWLNWIGYFRPHPLNSSVFLRFSYWPKGEIILVGDNCSLVQMSIDVSSPLPC
jgi:hypothetical protein